VSAARFWALAFVGLSALATGFFWIARLPDTSPTAPIAPSTLYATRLPDLNGAVTLLGRWQGHVLVLNFWASWCAPCREEMPQLDQLQRRRQGSGVQIVGIAVDSPDEARALAQVLGVTYPILVDEAGGLALAQRLGDRVGALPFTAIIDTQGRVRFTASGPLTVQKLDEVLDQLTAGAARAGPSNTDALATAVPSPMDAATRAS
jgi:thiol-disulfide isomerase/thioredoxin